MTDFLEVPGARIAHDVRPGDSRFPPLLMIGQPMTAEGFGTLATFFPDRTVVTYDPRGLGRSTRSDGRIDNDPVTQAEDVHALTESLGDGPVDLFASSGGAVTALALVAAHPLDVRVLVAHEPPTIGLLPDAAETARAEAWVRDTYHARGFGAGMAAFIKLASWQGEIPAGFTEGPAPDPAQFGLPTEDDGNRTDPLLSGVSAAVTAYVPDVEAIKAAPTRVVLAQGEESAQQMPGRGAAGVAAALGQEVVQFPSNHGGFLGPGFGQAGQPEAFAARLREVLDSWAVS